MCFQKCYLPHSACVLIIFSSVSANPQKTSVSVLMGKEQRCHKIIQFFKLVFFICLIIVLHFVCDCCYKILTFKTMHHPVGCSTVICQTTEFRMFISVWEFPAGLPGFPEEKEKFKSLFPHFCFCSQRKQTCSSGADAQR